MRFIRVALPLVILFSAAPVAAQQGASSAEAARHESLSPEDQRFLNYAAEDNQAEIQLCLLAEKRAAALPVKAFARLMVNDHVEVESRLAALINAEGVEVPNGIGEEGRNTASRLEPLRGAAFDREFMKKQIEDHSHDIERYMHEVSTTRNEGVRRFAAETVPLLKQHLALAHAVEAAVGTADKAGSGAVAPERSPSQAGSDR